MLIVNVGFFLKEKERIVSLRNMIGILLNSLMTILSFNHFDFGLMFGNVREEDRQARMHRSKFWRQFAYNCVIVAVNLGLTIWTAVTMTDIVYDEKSGTGI